jgi:hypothetical protein
MNTTRAQILALLGDLGKLYPEMRFGQLIASMAYWTKGPVQSAVWDVEDEELLRTIQEHIQKRPIK